MWRDDVYLLDMLLAASDAREFAKDLDWQRFSASDLHQSAIIRKLEIIGEAAGRVSGEFQSRHPEIPWPEIVALRNRLIHGYRTVRLGLVWQVVQEELPTLIEMLQPLVPPAEDFK
ncbi:MAG: DUF86 domain-containing protein [Accumulibacter sp.]|jgi:uncharacterized protein with HEPN domain|uniref:HepT-like ribonuclease domain-containing protein n=1 Tax=Accumulibacter sp. TaxID=2053492 RepID=UPI002FC2D4FF